MSLTAEQIAARKGKLTASRVAVLMNSDAAGIDRLYREMIGACDPENLDHIWAVRLGSVTEQLNLDWFEMQYGQLTQRGAVVVHPEHKWAAATLDAWHPSTPCPVETKHVGGREPLEVIIERYQPQMQFQMFVTETDECALSVIMGANEPIVEFIPRDEDYIKEIVSRGSAFMLCVQTRSPPVTIEAAKPPVLPVRKYDFTGKNLWASAAGKWLENREAARAAKEAEAILKSEVPEDAKECFGHGIVVKRDRGGRLSLREVMNESA
jgi:predicted phage-related endonuclease